MGSSPSRSCLLRDDVVVAFVVFSGEPAAQNVANGI